ncbi:DUF1592 domain-containing protein [bacterium]|nr:DUF1592 domain-containing protein [bacterium]
MSGRKLSNGTWFVGVLALSVGLAGSPGLWADERSTAAKPTAFASRIAPFLQKHCVSCHGDDSPEGGLSFSKYRDSANIQSDYELWEHVVRLLNERQMPPADEPQPSAKETVEVVSAIRDELAKFDCSESQHPGRVTIRRLNKAEYNNTIRDLLGLDFQPADDFPSDDVGEGFDNIGDVLTIPPILMEKYLAAAEEIATRALADKSARKRILAHTPADESKRIETAIRNVREFAERAYRRPIDGEEAQRLFAIMRFAFEQGAPEDEIFSTVVQAILVSPHFLFRVERDPSRDDKNGIRELDDFEVATRLSYFLWSSMPDDELFDLAQAGRLTQQETLLAQTKRMLADPKSRALVENFAGQWLQLRDVSHLAPDPKTFPEFDDELRAAMLGETQQFFATLIREDRSVLELLDADYSFVNERLAEHYGIEGISGSGFQRVSLDNRRRGVLTHASILMLTSNPTRTSPVKRGKWILDNVLGEPPPAPPANVPPLDENAETLGSLRERMEQHRTNEACAVCHRRMDALGFGLENFDAIGKWRDRDGRYEIDPSGTLPGDRVFSGPAGLMTILATEKKDAFRRCLTKKLLTYALGRGLVSYDRCTIESILRQLDENDNHFSALVAGIVTSDPFLMREVRRDR